MKINQSLIKTINRIAKHFIKIRSEPQIKRKCDRDGNYYWQIYNPISRCSVSFGSEQEVRLWLEQNF